MTRLHLSSLLLGFLLLASALAGCSDDPPASQRPSPGTGAAPSLAGPGGQAPAPAMEAPKWNVGDWWGHHVYFGPDDQEGSHYNVIMVENSGGKALLAADDPVAAEEHAIFDFPILGEFGPGIDGTAFGGAWKIFDFPLSDGHTWRTSLTIPDFESFQDHAFDVEFTATYNPEIPTLQGPKPGYEIVGATPDGLLLLSHDYVEEIGWYANFALFNFLTDDPLDFYFSSKSMGFGQNWTGTYYLDEARALVEHFSAIFPDNEDPAESTVAPKPHASFTVSDDATYLYGWIFSFAFAGAHETILIDPAHESHQYTATGAPEGFEFDFWNMDAIPGQWEIGTLGAGVAAGGGAFLWEIVEGTGML